MLRSMYSGISGMKGFQQKLDVIGNNISNVNTAGFKKGRVTFQDLMSQMSSGAQGATDTRGGVNPSQVGLGSQTGSIDDLHTQGSRETTNNPLDFALEGDGMFAVAGDTQPGDLQNSNVSYTRAGNFYLDEEGNVVNSDGLYLMGFAAEETGEKVTTAKDSDGNTISVATDANNDIDTITYKGQEYSDTSNVTDMDISVNNGTVSIEDTSGSNSKELETAVKNIVEINQGTKSSINIPESAQSYSVQTNGTVNYINEDGDTQTAGQIAVASFSNPAGLQKAGNSVYQDTENAGYNGLNTPGTEGSASIVSGALEMSNVDLASEFTDMITAQRGFQANTRIITTSDEILQELVNLKR